MPLNVVTAFDDVAPKSEPPKESRGEAELSRAMAEFNRRYAVVNEGGKAVVYERTSDLVLKRSVIVRIQFSDLKKLYQHQKISVPTKSGGSITKSPAEWWLSHRDRRTYLDGVVFDPTGNAPPTCWNLWNGFAVEPLPGDWSRLKDHVRNVICAGDEDHFKYVLGWAARMFQNRPNQAKLCLSSVA